MSEKRPMNMKAVKAIMNARILVPQSMIGRSVSLTIQGNGNIHDVTNSAGELVQSVVEPGTVFQKKIFNCKANSEIAMKNVRNNETLKKGIAAEKAGNPEEADKFFSEYLNKVQLSFNVPLPSSIVEHLGNGVDISAKVQKIDTEKGSLLTIDPKTIRVLEPEVLGTTNFSFDDFDEEDDIDVDAAFATDDEFTSMDRKALIAAVKTAGVKGLTKTSTDDEIRAALRAATTVVADELEA